MSVKRANILFILACTLLVNCAHSGKTGDSKQSEKSNSVTPATNQNSVISRQDSIQLAMLIRKIYRWHHAHQTEELGFEPKKKKTSDTLYTGIDFDAINISIKNLKATGFFDDSFLNNYRNIALRMDNELRSGKSTWHEGDLPPFNNNFSDPWCNCQDYPNNYWDKLTLTNLKADKDGASFKWTWGNNFYYKAKAIRIAGVWKVSYLQGFDPNHYNWAK